VALCNHVLGHTGPAGDLASPVHRLDPRAKVVGLLAVTVVAVSTPLALWPVLAACGLALAAVAAVARVPAATLWRRGRIVLVPVALVAVVAPLVRTGGWTASVGPLTVHEAGVASFGTVAAKALIGVVAAVLLGATTAFPSLLRGLEALRLPRLMVLIAGLMYRYLFVVVEEVARMRDALASRAYRPRNALQAGPIGRAAGTLFLRSYLRGERVHLAMLARGYDGAIPHLQPLRLRRADLAFIALVLVALVPLRVLAA
jgi:cobalt/nickel transport system permease protein